MKNNISDKELESLLLNFNNRENLAFSKVYEIIYDELFYFTSNVYRDTEVVASDVIHDIFIKLWENRNVKFSSIVNIKGYIYISVRNKFRDYISHAKIKDKFSHSLKMQDDYMVSQIVESETLSLITDVFKVLPSECAKVFKLFVDGWDAKEIAVKLNKSQSTIYAQKQEAIAIIKRKFSRDKLLFIMILMNP